MKDLILGLFLLSFVFPSQLKAAETDRAKAEDKMGNYRNEGIDVVQGRIFLKGGRHEFTFMPGIIANNTFIRYEPLQLAYTYHFTEALGFEGSYAYVLNQEKGILTDLGTIPCPNPNSDIDGDGLPDSICGITLDPPPDKLQHMIFGNFVWSPIYGKFAIFSKKIFHFDIYIVTGAGVYLNKSRASLTAPEETTKRFAFDVGLGIKIFLNEWSALRAEFRNYTVREGAPFRHIVNNRMASVGLSLFLPLKPTPP